MFVWQVPDGLGGTELCKHLSAMNLSHQSSLDSVGEPPGPQTSIQYIMAAQGQVPSVNMPQQSYTVAQVHPCSKVSFLFKYIFINVSDVTLG